MLEHISAWTMLIQALKTRSISLWLHCPVPIIPRPKHQMIGFQVSAIRNPWHNCLKYLETV
jgi:hypothetical protein